MAWEGSVNPKIRSLYSHHGKSFHSSSRLSSANGRNFGKRCTPIQCYKGRARSGSRWSLTGRLLVPPLLVNFETKLYRFKLSSLILKLEMRSLLPCLWMMVSGQTQLYLTWRNGSLFLRKMGLQLLGILAR